METKRGLFIAFEGIDGCGKSTQIWKLAKQLFNSNKYNHILLTREPFRDGNIRKILKNDEDPYSQAKKLAELFVNDRREHLNELILPSLSKGYHVLSDRYDCSTLAYQQTQGMSFEELFKMHQTFISPDLTFIVDLPVEIAQARMQNDGNRTEEQKFEKNKPFIEKLRQNYLELPSKIPNRDFVIINGIHPADYIFEKQIKPAFDKLYNSKFS